MAVIIQSYLFSFKEKGSEPIKEFKKELEELKDEELMRELERERGRGRNDYPIRAVWNSLVAMVRFEYKSIEMLRRQLKINGELRDACGFDPLKGSDAVPSASAYSRFIKKLLKKLAKLNKVLRQLIKDISKIIKGFGVAVAVDSKALESSSKNDKEATYGRKEVVKKTKKGEITVTTKSWKGFKLHVMLDTETELPIEFYITGAHESDTKNILPLFEKLKKENKEIYEKIKYVMADRGYDSEENHRRLLFEHNVKPIIDIRNVWQEKESTKLLNDKKADNIVYNYRGEIFCVCPATGEQRKMSFKGYEKKKKALKFVCPVKSYGISCAGSKECTHYNKSVRVSLKDNVRRFSVLPRGTYKWQKLYNKRNAVERLFSRLSGSFQIDLKYVRGIKGATFWVMLSFIVMLGVAKVKIENGEIDKIRSLKIVA